MKTGNYFVMLNHPSPLVRITPLVRNSEDYGLIAFFESEGEAMETAKDNQLAVHYGFTVHSIDGGCQVK